jgi:hypothetical protein
MYIVVAVCVDQNDHLALQETKRHQPFLAVVFPDVLAGNGKVVPNGVSPLEIQAVSLDVAPTFGFIPGGHLQIVVTARPNAKYFVTTTEVAGLARYNV